MPYFTLHKSQELNALVDHLKEAAYTPVAQLDAYAYVTQEPVSYADRMTGNGISVSPGQRWGNLFDCAWFHFTGAVPKSVAGQCVVLLIDINGEACIFDENGCPVQGLTNVNSEYDYSLGKPGKRVVPVADSARGGELIDLWADAGCNDLFGQYRDNGTLKEALVAVCHPNLRALSYDFEVLHELMLQLPETSARRQRIWTALTDAALVLQYYTDEEATRARLILAPELAKCGGDPSLTISAVGHAHIDLGWLWPIRETIRKGARTFSTVLHFMDRYPDYVFGASQAQLYLWMKQHYPALYAKVKQRIQEGRWEVQGAMWVEADTNMSGGEALVRQLLYGKRYFKNEFGIDVTNLWLPDVFGYSGALPQLLAKSGVKYFMTQKLSWSQVNKHPHHSFWWQGIDGTKILTHMAPEGTYNSSAAPRALAAAEANYCDKSVSEHCLLIYGIGDGGGGPGEEHLERLAREKNLQGLSPTKQEHAAAFFDRLACESSRFATWTGELYLERHQGTYTSQARNKRYNRKLELALRELELAASKAWWYTGLPYPKAELEEIWREVLLYQFHDILPGSSITRVYDESLARYKHLLTQTVNLTRIADQALYGAPAPADLQRRTTVNSLSWPRCEWIKIDGVWINQTVPAFGAAYADLSDQSPVSISLVAEPERLENELLYLTFNIAGEITSVFDKELDREFVVSGQIANRLALYRDIGDAWDMQMHYDEQQPERFELESSVAGVDGPQASLTLTFRHGKSSLRQQIVITAGSHRIDFITHVDWQETGRMLRTSFPMAVQTNEATFDIQYGNITRPTVRNTSWDMAQFEVCAHKWVDISERGFGVALLNDCKYGHKVIGSVLDLDLLRSPTHPDPVADKGEHDFTYSLLPHRGDYVEGEVTRRGYELNIPLRVLSASSVHPTPSRNAPFIEVDEPNIIVEAVKKGEDSNALIVRLYESTGTSVRTRIRLDGTASSITLVDLMENPIHSIPVVDGYIELLFHPFEIHTLSIAKV
jgi:alpha-mannosidase